MMQASSVVMQRFLALRAHEPLPARSFLLLHVRAFDLAQKQGLDLLAAYVAFGHDQSGERGAF